MLDFVKAFPSGDMEGVADALARMKFTKEGVDVPAFARDLGEVLQSVEAVDPNQIAAGDVDEGQLNRLVVSVSKVAPSCAARVPPVPASETLRESETKAGQPETSLHRRAETALPTAQVAERYGIRFPREFALLVKQVLYFDRYTRLLAPDLDVLNDERLSMNQPPSAAAAGAAGAVGAGGAEAVVAEVASVEVTEVIPPAD